MDTQLTKDGHEQSVLRRNDSTVRRGFQNGVTVQRIRPQPGLSVIVAVKHFHGLPDARRRHQFSRRQSCQRTKRFSCFPTSVNRSWC